ncbi:hypothetical protein DSM106972_091770 [Dulcicalothrix desertica PCC 7102]|uniref:Uncharacterized protein n=1 Tax=Dulcicalothrix desertica PCC 7102 TaxID=232991 RepID=A0A3S1IBH4_9CYAN|nr:hypothetical protein [Dulcicalothrix desertica]RUS94926.1 hypothetical protein DSM106972_091770 [Dulcicalothrix desertica PCC 7102]TWH62703.1 hypothetical protein CAL7102_00216 [Dulcicalothrix desertica PCC 7102]
MNEKYIQLEIWDLLEEARSAPLEVDWRLLWDGLDASLIDLDTTEQLQVAADALVQMVEVFHTRSVETFEEIESVIGDDGPVMGDADFAVFVRQTMDIRFDEFIEPLVSSIRKPYVWAPDTANHSIVQIVDKETLLETLAYTEEVTSEQAWESVLNIAHSEDVEAWVSKIREYIGVAPTQIITVSGLMRAPLELAPVEVWLGLLLGSLNMVRDCKFNFDCYDVFCEQFYASDILIEMEASMSGAYCS